MRSISILVAITMLASYLPAGAQSSWVSIVSPTTGDILGGRHAEVSISYNTGSSNKVTRIEIDVEGAPYASKNMAEPSARGVASFLVDTTRFQNGVHSIIAKVYSGNALIGSASTQCSVSNQPIDVLPPVVKFVDLHKDKAYSGTEQVEISARDNSDKDPLVSVFIDKSLKLIRNSPPYRYTWDTTQYENGRHVLQAYAYDEAGNKSEAQSVEVTVANGGRAPLTAEIPAETPSRTPTEVASSAPSAPATTLIPAPAETVVVPVERPVRVASAARTEVAPKVTTPRINSASAKPQLVLEPRHTEVKPEMKPAPAQVRVPASVTPVPAVKTPSRSIILAQTIEPKLDQPILTKPSVPIEHQASSDVAARSSEPKPSVESVKPVRVAAEPRTDSSAPASPSTASVPAKVPEKKPVAETLQTATVARIDQPLIVAEMPMPDLAAGPDPEPPTAEPATIAPERIPAAPAAIQSPRPDAELTAPVAAAPVAMAQPTPEPIVSAGTITVPDHGFKVASDKPSSIELIQKVSAPAVKLFKSVKMAMAVKPETRTSDVYHKIKADSIRLRTWDYNGRTVTGLRAAIESAGGHIVSWNRWTRTVTASFGGKRVEVRVGKQLAKIDGMHVEAGCAPFIAGQGRTMVDVQFLKGVLGSRLEANDHTREYRIM